MIGASMSDRMSNAVIATVGVTLALACTGLWSLLSLHCGSGSCDQPRLDLLTIVLLSVALAGWVAGLTFGLNALWDKPVARGRIALPVSAGVVLFCCFTMQIAIWAR
jgi:hypothetical protein